MNKSTLKQQSTVLESENLTLSLGCIEQIKSLRIDN